MDISPHVTIIRTYIHVHIRSYYSSMISLTASKNEIIVLILFLVLQKSHSKSFRWKYKNESHKPSLGNKKQKSISPAVSQSRWIVAFLRA